MKWLARARRALVPGDRRAWRGSSWSGSRWMGCASPAGSRPSAPTCLCSLPNWPPARARRVELAVARTQARPVDDDQWRDVAADRRRPARRRSGPGQHQPRHTATGALPRDDPPRRAGARARRDRGGGPGRVRPVKLNAVIERGVNDDEIVDLARFGRDRGIELRYIEFMPLDAGGHWRNAQVVSQEEIVAAIAEVFPLEQLPARGAAPADRWRYLDGRGTVGVIPTVTKPFCADCDRVRLTADGQLPHLPVRHHRLRPADDDPPRCRRRSPRRGDRACRRDEVGRSPDQPGQLHPPCEVDEPDRRLITDAAAPTRRSGPARRATPRCAALRSTWRCARHARSSRPSAVRHPIRQRGARS